MRIFNQRDTLFPCRNTLLPVHMIELMVSLTHLNIRREERLLIF